jgi:hypothetical protein
MEIPIMAHFAQLDSNNIVLQVLVVDNDMIKNEQGNEQEQIGIDFLKSLIDQETIWKQTSYNGNFRKNYAGIGDNYDITRDAFISPKPPAFQNGDVWELDEETCRWFDPKAPEHKAIIGISRV